MDLINIILLFGIFTVIVARRPKILPDDDKQFKRVGKNAHLWCTVEGHFKNPKKVFRRLTFLWENEIIKNSFRKNVTKVNGTTIQLEIRNATKNDNGIYMCCLLKKQSDNNCKKVSTAELVFGEPPAVPVLSPANCTNFNMESMTCLIDKVKTEEDLGNVPTSWDVSFRYYNGSRIRCDETKPEKKILICNITSFWSKTNHKFEVEAANLIGNATKRITINPLNVIQPGAVKQFQVDSSHSGLNLSWTSPLDCTDKHLLFIISYTSKWEKSSSNVTVNCTNETFLSSILPRESLISGVLYKVCIKSKPLDGTGYFSLSVCKSVTTSVGVPKSGPIVHPWFYSLDCRHYPVLALYWKEIPLRQRGSKNLKNYNIFIGSQEQYVNGTDVSVIISYTELCSGGYRTAFIQAETSAGASDITSSIKIFSPNKVPAKPYSVQKIMKNSKLKVTWKTEKNTHPPDVIRVHWCYGYYWKKTDLVHCQNEIAEIVVSNTDEFMIHRRFSGNPIKCANCDWRIAISMETDGISSGLTWERNPLSEKIIFKDGDGKTVIIICVLVTFFICVMIICFLCFNSKKEPREKIEYPSHVYKLFKNTEDSKKSTELFKNTEDSEKSTEPLCDEHSRTDDKDEKPAMKDSGHKSSLLSSKEQRSSFSSDNNMKSTLNLSCNSVFKSKMTASSEKTFNCGIHSSGKRLRGPGEFDISDSSMSGTCSDLNSGTSHHYEMTVVNKLDTSCEACPSSQETLLV